MSSGKIITNTYQGLHYELNWNSSINIGENHSTINYTLSAAGLASSYWVAERTLIVTLAGQTIISKSDRVQRYNGVIKTGSFIVAHDSSGNASISGSIRAAVVSSGVNCYADGSWNLDRIPRQANITGAPNFNDEENPTITYNNPAGNNVQSLEVCISLTGNPDIPYRPVDKNGSSYTFNLTPTERDILRKGTTGSNSRQVTFHLKTIVGGNTFFSTATKTLTIINAQPIISPTAEDINPTTLALTGDKNKVIRYESNIKCIMNPQVFKFAGIEGTTIENGSQYIYGTSGTFNKVESGDFNFIFRDTRQNSITKKITKTLIPYISPTCNIIAKNPTADGKMKILLNGNCFKGSFGKIDNTITLQYRKKEGYGEYENWETVPVTLNDNHTYSTEINLANLDYRKSYVFQARIIDKINTVESAEKAVKTIPVFDWSEDDFNFNVQAKMQGNPLASFPLGAIYISTNSTSPASLFGGTWEQLKDRFLIGASDNYKVGSIGGNKQHSHEYGYSFGEYYGDTVMLDNQAVHNVGALDGDTGGWKGPVPNGKTYAIINRGVQDAIREIDGMVRYEVRANTFKNDSIPPYIAVYIWKRVS